MRTARCELQTSASCAKRSAWRRALLKAGVLTAMAAVLAGCMGYVPGRQTYWDAKVKEMCEKDGGVKVLGEIVVSQVQANTLPRVGGFFGVAPEALAKPEDPAFAKVRVTKLHDGEPSVIREEQDIVRRSDQRLVARVIRYGRSGGDFPLVSAHPSTYSCPEYRTIYEGIHRIFRVEEAKK